jgi:hypothetical protein
VQAPPPEAEGGVAVPKVKAAEESQRGRWSSPQTMEKQVAVEEVKVLKDSRTDSGGGQGRPSAVGAEVAVEEAAQAAEQMEVGEDISRMRQKRWEWRLTRLGGRPELLEMIS